MKLFSPLGLTNIPPTRIILTPYIPPWGIRHKERNGPLIEERISHYYFRDKKTYDETDTAATTYLCLLAGLDAALFGRLCFYKRLLPDDSERHNRRADSQAEGPG